MALVDHVRPRKVVALHQPLEMVNPTGTGHLLATAMAAANGYRIDEDTGSPTPGAFGTYCGVELGLMMVTLELTAGGAQEAWELQREARLVAVRYTAGGLSPWQALLPSVKESS